MKKIILFSSLLFSALIYSQILKNSLNETFNNNSNGWKIEKYSTNWNSNINNGKLEFSNNSSDNYIYLKPYDLKIQEKERYEIETVFKTSLKDDNSLTGIIFIDEEIIENSSYSLKTGYIIYIDKYENKYFLSLRKTDEETPKGLIELKNFNEKTNHKMKILIDNSLPKVEIFIDNSLIFSEKMPLFNFHNIGFYIGGKSSLNIDYLVVQNSENKTKIPYDVNDMIYDNESKKHTLLKGSYYLKDLLNYVPEALLIDSYDQNNYEFKIFKDRIVINNFCEKLKTIDIENKKGYTKAFTFEYKKSQFFVYITKDNKFKNCKIKFEDNYKAKEFFDLYSKAKKYQTIENISVSNFNQLKSINIENNIVIINY